MDATADEAIEDEWSGGPITRVPRTQRLRRLRLVQGCCGEDSPARLRRRSTTCSGLIQTAISSAPSMAVRGKDEGGTNKLIDEKAIKETSEPVASPTRPTPRTRHLQRLITQEDRSDDVSIHCKQLDGTEALQQEDTVSHDTAKSQRHAHRGQLQLHWNQRCNKRASL